MKKLIVIAGATASGKTNLAIQLAKHFNTKIISADSRQCYKELNIGVAKPTVQELNTIHHFFVNSHSIHNALNVADFEKLALEYLNEIFNNNDIAILVGGTGLYINALCYGINEMPQINETINAEVNKKYQELGLEWLQNCIALEDEMFYKTGEIQNPARCIRALVFKRSIGKSILEFRNYIKVKRNFDIEQYVIDIPRETLYNRINCRVDEMIQNGLVEEVQQLQEFQKLKNLHTVGYRELFDYFNKKTTLNEAIDLIKQNTRHYAKRQITWFKKDENIIWKSADEILKTLCK